MVERKIAQYVVNLETELYPSTTQSYAFELSKEHYQSSLMKAADKYLKIGSLIDKFRKKIVSDSDLERFAEYESKREGGVHFGGGIDCKINSETSPLDYEFIHKDRANYNPPLWAKIGSSVGVALLATAGGASAFYHGQTAAMQTQLSQFVNFLIKQYGKDALPSVYAQNTYGVIKVGMVTVPVTRDGKISPGEYDKDSIPNRYLVFYNTTNVLPQGYIFVKNDGTWTYFGMDFPTDKCGQRNFVLSFDTHNVGQKGDVPPNTPGAYNLALLMNGNSVNQSTTLQTAKIGTPFDVHQKGKDYDWQYYCGPSSQSPDNHTQIEVQVLTKILTKYSNDIHFLSSFGVQNSYVLTSPNYAEDWGHLVFLSYTIPTNTTTTSTTQSSQTSVIPTTSQIHITETGTPTKEPMNDQALLTTAGLAGVSVGALALGIYRYNRHKKRSI